MLLVKCVYLTLYVENLISQNTELCSLIIVSALHVVLQYHLTCIKHRLGSGGGWFLKNKGKVPGFICQCFADIQYFTVNFYSLAHSLRIAE